ncbi:MAG: hypothetical protein AAFY36_04340 [Bacteroidota bacterium]
MSRKALKKKWLRTKMALSETMQKILDLNRDRKRMYDHNICQINRDYDEELRILNATAELQSRVLRVYDEKLKRTA